MLSLVPSTILKNINSTEIAWLESIFNRFKNQYPSLEELWGLMDEVWRQLNCNSKIFDDRIIQFYNHPVWLLNGLFIEQDKVSLMHRKIFTKWICKHSPQRVADYGGGFGTLARMIGKELPDTIVEVIEPYPHPAAVALADATPNVRYCERLARNYDVIIATDVFEHVPDPLDLAFQTAHHLNYGGYYLTANCFYPVILCHLPQTFHFRFTWNTALRQMGLVPVEPVAYGYSFKRKGNLSLTNARDVEYKSMKVFELMRFLPNFIARYLTKIFFL